MNRFSLSLLATLLLATATVAVLPGAEATAICTIKDPGCPAVLCIGYNSQTGWQKCYLRIDDVPVPCRDYPCHEPFVLP